MMPAFLRRCVRTPRIAAIALAVLAYGGSTASAQDLLDQPAKPSRHMAETLQTAVARAGERLVTVGAGGLITLSDDNARSWRPAKTVPVSVLLTNVYFVSAQQGWAIGHGGVVLASDDGGENWHKQLDGLQAAQIELTAAEAAMHPDDPAGARRLREAERLVADGADKPLLGIYFSDAAHGIVVGAYGLAMETADGGKTWQSLIGAIDNPRGKHLYSVTASKNILFITGEEGSVFRSTDGGKNFVALKTPSRGTFFGLLATEAGDVVAFGLRGDAYRSTDNGNDWQKINLPTSGLNCGIRLSDGRLAIVDDWGELLLSSDGGSSFVSAGTPQAMGLLGVVQNADGTLTAAGTKGNVRIAINGPQAEPSK